jgi:hypothetical protein
MARTVFTLRSVTAEPNARSRATEAEVHQVRPLGGSRGERTAGRGAQELGARPHDHRHLEAEVPGDRLLELRPGCRDRTSGDEHEVAALQVRPDVRPAQPLREQAQRRHPGQLRRGPYRCVHRVHAWRAADAPSAAAASA